MKSELTSVPKLTYVYQSYEKFCRDYTRDPRYIREGNGMEWSGEESGGTNGRDGRSEAEVEGKGQEERGGGLAGC